MRIDDKNKVLHDFFIDHAKFDKIAIPDIKDWIGQKYMGMFSGRNDFYEILNLMKMFMEREIKNIYSFKLDKIEVFLKDNPEVFKKYKKKRGEI